MSQRGNMKNISKIVDTGLCTQCGGCVGFCPQDAIGMVQHEKKGLLPLVDEDVCNGCGICLRVCPGESLHIPKMNHDLFGKQPENPYFGSYIRLLAGYTKFPKIRYNGASGGVVTGILVELLRQGKIDGALVVKMSIERPFEPQIFIARTEQEIISAQQSKYLPVPMNAALKQIHRSKNEKIAIVGLPCHIQSLRKAEKIFPGLRKKIAIRIGLFCGYNPTLSSTKWLARRAGARDLSQIEEIRYRDGDWPCGFHVILKDGKNFWLHPTPNFVWAHWVFERHRCAMCNDQLCELADISVGDEWKPVHRKSKNGWCYVITRTPEGDQMISSMVNDNILYMEKTTIDEIYSGNYATLIFRKRGNRAFFQIKKMFGKKFPNYYINMNPDLKLQYYVGAFLLFTVSTLFEIKFISRLFLKVPARFFRKYVYLIIKLFEK
jgi:coenzyme F420 hydrogenase subunit beta